MRKETGFVSLSKLKYTEVVSLTRGNTFYVGTDGDMTQYMATSDMHYNADCNEPDYEINAVRTDLLKKLNDWKTVTDTATIWWGDIYVEDNSCPLCGMDKEIDIGDDKTGTMTSQGLLVNQTLVALHLSLLIHVKHCPECGHIILYKKEV